ncbi:RNA polymerase sigma factor sigF, chloroplastic-like isoform X2 [Impatiens glandulifera]|uniref:RNA polymerase sigma factor sigF, chloroplastic-like isoform X2 n=1 Tax=Impatiens glandulifera TaxID=253017 RepID=UPI001FB0DD70|nr:RNA polymerase sigma factor sigF, chloroplastic-like isoform X2 [Impatiens glandulifera]
MESGRNLLASAPPFPARNNVKNCTSSSSSVPAFSNASSSSSSRHDENRAFFQELKDNRVSHMLEMRKKNYRPLEDEEDEEDQYVKDFQSQLLSAPDFMHLLQSQETPNSSPLRNETKQVKDFEPGNVVALAKKALSASKQAALLCADLKSYEIDAEVALSDDSSLLSESLPEFLQGEKVVRSTRLLERRSKRQTVSKPNITNSLNVNPRKTRESFDPNDGLRRFLLCQDTKQLLTPKEESDLIDHIQNLMKLDEVKSRLHTQFNRDPTPSEWAEATNLTSRELKSIIHLGNSSRERIILANLRMVVHIAKQYQGRGLNLPDLLQEGSMGLLKSVEKFKPHIGCRFASYAYWWIRQSIRKAIFQHSRTIRLPDNVYALLHKVAEAKRSIVREGNHQPTKEEIAIRSGITMDKLDSLLFSSRNPLSIQQAIWTDQDATFQEVIADTSIETPDVSVTKQLMRQHVHRLLGSLTPRERRIVRLRYGVGVESEKPRSLQEIGDGLGLSKERVRQIESRAFYKLKQNLSGQGLDVYANLVT